MTRSGSLDLLWEVPLAVLSWSFHRLTRLALAGLARLRVTSSRQQSAEWHPISAEVITRRLMLPAIMTSAPRWNPHALIAGLGPFQAESSIGIDAGAASRSARTWTAVMHRVPGSRIVGSVGSQDAPSEDGWARLPVEPGAYRVVLRYYHRSDDAALPDVQADGVEVAKGMPLAADSNDQLYRALPRLRGRFYLAQQYYVYTMLRLKRWLPQSFVERELLPIGNPETRFYYGHCPAGCSLHLQAAESVTASHDVYLTLYGRDSFPLHWQQVVVPELRTDPLARDGFYLLRVHRATPSAPPLDPNSVAITLEQMGSGDCSVRGWLRV
jgi:hypothetical protein